MESVAALQEKSRKFRRNMICVFTGAILLLGYSGVSRYHASQLPCEMDTRSTTGNKPPILYDTPTTILDSATGIIEREGGSDSADPDIKQLIDLTQYTSDKYTSYTVDTYAIGCKMPDGGMGLNDKGHNIQSVVIRHMLHSA